MFYPAANRQQTCMHLTELAKIATKMCTNMQALWLQ